jgi:hypothetical protein
MLTFSTSILLFYLLLHIFIVTIEHLYRKLKSLSSIWLCETNMTIILYKICKCYYIQTVSSRNQTLSVPIMCFTNKHFFCLFFFFSFWAESCYISKALAKISLLPVLASKSWVYHLNYPSPEVGGKWHQVQIISFILIHFNVLLVNWLHNVCFFANYHF